jgi:hypothetical protein
MLLLLIPITDLPKMNTIKGRDLEDAHEMIGCTLERVRHKVPLVAVKR